MAMIDKRRSFQGDARIQAWKIGDGVEVRRQEVRVGAPHAAHVCSQYAARQAAKERMIAEAQRHWRIGVIAHGEDKPRALAVEADFLAAREAPRPIRGLERA